MSPVAHTYDERLKRRDKKQRMHGKHLRRMRKQYQEVSARLFLRTAHALY